jgi:hypothetical protein
MRWLRKDEEAITETAGSGWEVGRGLELLMWM